MWVLIKALMKEEEGTETVEWTIVVGLLILAVAGAWVVIGGGVSAQINTLAATVGAP